MSTQMLDRPDVTTDYVEAEAGRQRTSRSWVVGVGVAAAALAVLLLGIFAFGRANSSSSTSVAPAAVPPSVPDARTAGRPLTPQEADELLKQQMAAGWVPYAGAPAAGDAPPPLAWQPYSANPRSADVETGPNGGQPVYDAPNGNVVGYHYTNLGYVSKAHAESGQFDPAQARIAKFGCDPQGDPACRDRLALEQMKKEGITPQPGK